MKKNKSSLFLKSMTKTTCLKIIKENIKLKRNRLKIFYFTKNIINDKKCKKEWSKIIDKEILDNIIYYLEKYNTKEVYRSIFSVCLTEKNKLYFIKKIIDNNKKKKIIMIDYFLEIKKDIISFDKKLISENEKRRLIIEIENIYINQIQSEITIIPYPKITLLNDEIFMNNLDKYLCKYKSYSKNSVGFLLALKDFLIDDKEKTEIKLDKEYVLDKFPNKIKTIISNSTIRTSGLHYQSKLSQEMPFEELLNHHVLCYKLARFLIIKEKMFIFFNKPNDSEYLKLISENIQKNLFYKLRSYKIKQKELTWLLESIKAFLYGYYHNIFAAIPIIEKLYKESFSVQENFNNEKFIVKIPELYNNEMIRNIFLKPSQLIENKESSTKYSLNIKNDFFHYKFKDEEIMNYMAMYVFEFLMKEFIF